jgi:predicted amino acid dehydrogenase
MSAVYDAWVTNTKAPLIDMWGDAWRVHGGAVVMPSNVPPSMQKYAGQPAAMYDNETYVELGNAGWIDMRAPQVASNNGRVVYVLAPPEVIAAAPQTMTNLQRVANAVFTAGDIGADVVGLPSLTGIEDFLKGAGKQILTGAIVAIGVTYLTKRLLK